MNFEEELTRSTELVNNIIQGFLPREEGFQKTLLEAMNYSMNAGGKRLRPLLMLQTYKLFGGGSAVVEPFMAAMEMIHTHSLIHDDLPAMDNDEYRRGRKTTHVVYGEAMGILAGDALLNYAYETASKAFVLEPDNQNVGRAFHILASKTGVYGMIGGQSVDVENEKNANISMSQEQLDFIYRLKTSALIEASMMIGASPSQFSGLAFVAWIGLLIAGFYASNLCVDVLKAKDQAVAETKQAARKSDYHINVRR